MASICTRPPPAAVSIDTFPCAATGIRKVAMTRGELPVSVDRKLTYPSSVLFHQTRAMPHVAHVGATMLIDRPYAVVVVSVPAALLTVVSVPL